MGASVETTSSQNRPDAGRLTACQRAALAIGGRNSACRLSRGLPVRRCLLCLKARVQNPLQRKAEQRKREPHE